MMNKQKPAVGSPEERTLLDMGGESVIQQSFGRAIWLKKKKKILKAFTLCTFFDLISTSTNFVLKQ